jgi:hypothetical protein
MLIVNPEFKPPVDYRWELTSIEYYGILVPARFYFWSIRFGFNWQTSGADPKDFFSDSNLLTLLDWDQQHCYYGNSTTEKSVIIFRNVIFNSIFQVL